MKEVEVKLNQLGKSAMCTRQGNTQTQFGMHYHFSKPMLSLVYCKIKRFYLYIIYFYHTIVYNYSVLIYIVNHNY